MSPSAMTICFLQRSQIGDDAALTSSAVRSPDSSCTTSRSTKPCLSVRYGRVKPQPGQQMSQPTDGLGDRKGQRFTPPRVICRAQSRGPA